MFTRRGLFGLLAAPFMFQRIGMPPAARSIRHHQISFGAILNDDLAVFTDVCRQIAIGAKRIEERYAAAMFNGRS